MEKVQLNFTEHAAAAVQQSQELRAINIGVYNRLVDLENTRYEVCLHSRSYAHYSEPMRLAEVIDYLTWIKPERYNQCMVLAVFPTCDNEQYKNIDIEEREFFIIEPDGDLRPSLITGFWHGDEDNVLITQGEIKQFLMALRAQLDEARKEANDNCLTK